MKTWNITDKDEKKWKIAPRAYLLSKYTSGKDFMTAQQKAANEQREKGRENVAIAIEKKTFISWCADSGYLTAKWRLDKNGKIIK